MDVAASVAVARGAIVDDFDRLVEIPAFDADREDERIVVIEDWRQRIDTADVVLVAAPEYAGGMAGALKNHSIGWSDRARCTASRSG